MLETKLTVYLCSFDWNSFTFHRLKSVLKFFVFGSFEKIWMYMLIRIRKSESIFLAPKVWRSTFKKGLSIRWNVHKFEWAKHKDIKKNKFSFHSAFIMVEMEFLQEQEINGFFLPLSLELFLLKSAWKPKQKFRLSTYFSINDKTSMESSCVVISWIESSWQNFSMWIHDRNRILWKG